MEIVKKRKLKEVIRGLIGDGFTGTQIDLVKALKQRGFKVTQSTVSRSMNEMGVFKESKDGKAVYKLNNMGSVAYRGSLGDLVIGMEHNQSLIVIKTRAGSAMFVAGFIDHECKATCLGSVAGDDTIFVAPRKPSQIAEVMDVIKKRLSTD